MIAFEDFLLFLGKYIFLLKDNINYFPLITICLSFFLCFFLSEIDRSILLKKTGKLPAVTFLKEPSTWVFKVFLTAWGSYAFLKLLQQMPDTLPRIHMGIIVSFAMFVAAGIAADPAKRLYTVKIKGVTDPEKLGVTEAWFNQWWAWRPKTFQPGALYNSFFLFPAYYFFSAIALGLVVSNMFIILQGNIDKSHFESLYNSVRSGNLYIILTGIGMIFNLVYYPSLYPGLYGKTVVRLYALIFVFCAFCGLYSELLLLEQISPTSPDTGPAEPLFMQFTAKVAFSCVTLAGIVFNEAVKNLVKRTVDFVYTHLLNQHQ